MVKSKNTLKFLLFFILLFYINPSFFSIRKLIVCDNIPVEEGDKNLFNKLDKTEDVSMDDVSDVFPALKPYSSIIAQEINKYKKNLDIDVNNLPFRCCGCFSVNKRLRLFLLLCQINEIVNIFPDRSKLFVHTSFAEGGLLQSWRLANLLLSVGYRRVHFNLIGINILGVCIDHSEYSSKDFTQDSLARTFCEKLDSRYVTARIYSSSMDYLGDSDAVLSHSFDIVDGGSEFLSGEALYSTEMQIGTRLAFCPLVLLCVRNAIVNCPIVRIYLSHHNPVRIIYNLPLMFLPLKNFGNSRHENNEKLKLAVVNVLDYILGLICDNPSTRESFIDALNDIFLNRYPILQSLSRFTVEVTDDIWINNLFTGGDAKFYLKFFHSLPLEFSEIVDKLRACETPIVFEAQRKWLSVYYDHFEPDFSLYQDRDF